MLLRTARDVLRGLALLHSAGYAHCDVKSDNIMYETGGGATLIDLGAATRLGEATREGAPEAMALGLDVSHASMGVDLSCLAFTLWWAATGGEPPSGSRPHTLAAEAQRRAGGGEGGGRGGGSSRVFHAIAGRFAAILSADTAMDALSAL
jgi:serine/threonine protein kinase